MSCQRTKNEVIVKGKFVGEIPQEIKYSIPINGICYGFFQASEEVDSVGNFEFRFNIESPCFITMIPKGNTGQLIVEPGENYLVTIEANNHKNQFRVDCKNPAVQLEYQKLVSPEHPQFEAVDILNYPISVAKNKIDSMYNIEVATFVELFNDEIISKELFDLITLDRTLYYNCVQGQIAMIKFYNTIRKDSEANTDSINQVWNEAISCVPLNSNNFINSKWAYFYIENYLMYNEYTAKDFKMDVRSKARKDGVYHTYLIDIAKKYLNDEILEFYTSSYILTKSWQKIFEEELIGLYEESKTDFPESKYKEYLEPRIKEIIDFHKKAELEFDEGIRFLDNYEELNSLTECLQSFKGKKVYVDIWATWCAPCKKEFAYSKELKNLLKSKNTEILYISKDRDEEDKRWKDMIKYYQLTGNHLRANYELKADLKKILGRFGIPRYLLVDENGKIISDDAKRPSAIKELEKQLNKK
jgi:thiol-disulfide isomerase/thioredoxin